MQFDPMPQKDTFDKLQYAFTGPWKVTAALKGASYELEDCSTPSQKEKSMHPTYLRTPPSSYHSNRSMALTLGTVSCKSRLQHTPSRRRVSRGSRHCHHSRSPTIFSQPTKILRSTGQASWNWMTKLFHSLGPWRRSGGNSSWVILSQLFRSCTQDHHPPPPPILVLLFLHWTH